MHKLTNFFNEKQLNRLLAACNDEDLVYPTDNGDTTYATKWNSNDFADIQDKCDTMFIEYGYDTSHSSCRLQRTEPNATYKTHRDFMGKRISLVIYLEGADGTIFYKDAVKQADKTFKGIDPTEDTFTPNAGYWFDNHTEGQYHMYQNTQTTPRWIFMYNIMQMDGGTPIVRAEIGQP